MNDFFLADDLSGALDAAAAFHHAGHSVRIVLHDAAVRDVPREELLGITTETRNTAPALAASAVRRALQAGWRRGGRLLYKKIDSTLRGPVAAELAALLDEMPHARVLFAPANPRVGRTVCAGILRVNGVPLADTEFARDPCYPLRHSAVRDILGASGAGQVSIPDVLHDADLETAVAAMEAQTSDWVAVGSGALAVPVARRFAVAAGQIRAGAFSVPTRTEILMLGGSAHPLNLRQAETFATRCNVSAHPIAVEAPDVATDRALADLRAHGAAAILPPPIRLAPALALRAVIDAAETAIKESGTRRVFATGGETAFALCQRLGVTSLRFLAEIEAGLSLSAAVYDGGPLLLAVKPGGFGDELTWIRAFERLRRPARSG